MRQRNHLFAAPRLRGAALQLAAKGVVACFQEYLIRVSVGRVLVTSTPRIHLFALISTNVVNYSNTSRTTLPFLRLSSNLAIWLRLCPMARYDL